MAAKDYTLQVSELSGAIYIVNHGREKDKAQVDKSTFLSAIVAWAKVTGNPKTDKQKIIEIRQGDKAIGEIKIY